VTITVLDTDEAVAEVAAARIAGALQASPALTLGLAAGRTPLRLYAALAHRYALGEIDFRSVSTFTLDEFVGLGPADSNGFGAFIRRHLLDLVNVDPARAHFPDGRAPDLAAECERYEAAIAAAGGIDLQLLGIGRNGHIGFNEPGDTLSARTHRVALRDETRREHAAAFGGDVSRVPTHALSMGMATILRANAILLLATGAEKAAVVARAMRGPVTTQLPASFLQTHRNVEVFVDRLAAGALDDQERAGALGGSV
jgi:glucosamine-6-phosphate deaminase